MIILTGFWFALTIVLVTFCVQWYKENQTRKTKLKMIRDELAKRELAKKKNYE